MGGPQPERLALVPALLARLESELGPGPAAVRARPGTDGRPRLHGTGCVIVD